MVKVTAEISEEALKALEELAQKRGVSANTVLQQAIVNEKFIDEKVGGDGKLLVRQPDNSYREIKRSA